MEVIQFLYLHELSCSIPQFIKIFGWSLDQTFGEPAWSDCRDQVMHGYLSHEISDSHANFIESLHECTQGFPFFLLYVKEGHR